MTRQFLDSIIAGNLNEELKDYTSDNLQALIKKMSLQPVIDNKLIKKINDAIAVMTGAKAPSDFYTIAYFMEQETIDAAYLSKFAEAIANGKCDKELENYSHGNLMNIILRMAMNKPYIHVKDKKDQVLEEKMDQALEKIMDHPNFSRISWFNSQYDTMKFDNFIKYLNDINTGKFDKELQKPNISTEYKYKEFVKNLKWLTFYFRHELEKNPKNEPVVTNALTKAGIKTTPVEASVAPVSFNQAATSSKIDTNNYSAFRYTP